MRNNYKKEYTLEDLKYLIDNIPYALWLKGSDGIYKYVNKYYAELTNMNVEDIIGKSDYDIRDKKTSELLLTQDREILTNEKTVFNKKVYVDMGVKNFFEVSKMIIKNNKNEKLIGGIGRNITINETLYEEIEKSTLTLLSDRKEENHSQLPYILKSALKASGINIFVFDEEHRKMKLFLKTYSDDIIPKDYSFYISEEDKEKCIRANHEHKCLETNYKGKFLNNYVRTYFIEFESELIGILNVYYENKDSYFHIEEHVIRDVCDRLGVIIKNRMLTNKYKTEMQKRKETEKKLQIFLQNSIDFYIIYDLDKLCFHNENSRKRLEDFFGYNIKEINRRHNMKILRHPDDEKRIKKIYMMAKECSKIEGVTIRYLCADNKYKSVKWNIRYISQDNNLYITGKDITASLELEEEKKELEKTVEMEILKTDFFANMSHEFKTPLNIILTTVQVLLDKMNNYETLCDEDTLRKYLKGIKQNSYRLLKIVNNIMDITKIDSGSYELELGNYNIVSVIEDIVLSVAGYFNQNKRNIVFDTMEEEIILACDPMKIERIMLNLLSNSLKYTNEDGNIKVFIDIDKDKNEAVISVENDGPPISDENKEKIFERFTRSENLLTRKAEGTGIGLFLVKMLVELHGGRIYVDSSQLKGTKFIFVLPIKLIEEKKENYTYTKQIVSKVETFNIEFSDIYSI